MRPPKELEDRTVQYLETEQFLRPFERPET
jgi:hypothetical protein